VADEKLEEPWSLADGKVQRIFNPPKKYRRLAAATGVDRSSGQYERRWECCSSTFRQRRQPHKKSKPNKVNTFKRRRYGNGTSGVTLVVAGISWVFLLAAPIELGQDTTPHSPARYDPSGAVIAGAKRL